jgi:hypothetical protein
MRWRAGATPTWEEWDACTADLLGDDAHNPAPRRVQP